MALGMTDFVSWCAGELVSWYACKMQNKRLNRSIEIASSRTHRNDRQTEWAGKNNSNADKDVDFLIV
jgi:hypothetical protein